MPTATITYFGQLTRVACDGQCLKAWGTHSRPKAQLSDDPDDYEFLADDELPTAPADPGTAEGGQSKPASAAAFPTRWCVRECERCALTPPGKPAASLQLPDFSRRLRNIP